MESGVLAWKTNGSLFGANGSYILRTGAKTDDDALQEITDQTPFDLLHLVKPTPEIEIGHLPSQSITSISATRGRLSTNQVFQISNAAFSTVFFEDIDIEDTSNRTTIAANLFFYVFESRTGKLSPFLKSIDFTKGNRNCIIYSPVTASDWPELVRISQNRPVSIYGGLAGPFKNVPRSSFPEDNITLFLNGGVNQNKLTDEQLKFVVQSDAKLQLLFVYDNQQFFWDLVFGFRDRVGYDLVADLANGLVPGRNLRNNAFDKKLEDLHLVFGKDKNGNITDLYLPGYEHFSHLKSLSSLKRLSTDINWLTNNAPLTTATIQDLSGLSKLVNLEELYLNDCNLDVKHMSFLKDLTKLRHLQIRVNRQPLVTYGLRNCQSLESITFLGKPKKGMINELARLPQLKTVTIVDTLNEKPESPKSREKLEKMLSNVEFKFVPAGEFFADIPDRFKEHLIEVRNQMQAEISGSVESEVP